MDILKISICILICLKTAKGCDCNVNEMIKDTVINNASNVMGKRQLQLDDDSDEDIINLDVKETTVTETSPSPSTSPSTVESTEVNNIIPTETVSEIKTLCPFYTQMLDFDYDKMVDVWKIVLYKASVQLSCFKIYIKRTLAENLNLLQDKFGDFNGTINWKDCLFEVASNTEVQANQKHFLQVTKEQNGVFDNIIVSQNEDGEVIYLEQSPGQWLVIEDLLLMRDCDNGDLVVFTRIPNDPSAREIEDALLTFGEQPGNLTSACETLSNHKHETLS